MKHRPSQAVLLVVLFSASVAWCVPLPADLKPVGQARLKVLWLSIYDAVLYNDSGAFNGVQGPLLLQLTYHRNISSQQLIDKTKQQWESVGVDARIATSWLQQLTRIWPDIKKSDSLIFYMDASGDGHYYHNKRFIGSINDAWFSQAFLNIWLADNSDYPELSSQLKGQRH